MDLFSEKLDLKDIKLFIDNIIIEFIGKENNTTIKEILEHSLIGGKRIRPIITFLIFQNFPGLDIKKVSKILIIPELIHNISLIIDDLPCMDNDNFRRDKETTHYKYGILLSYITIVKMINNILYNFKNDIDINKKFSYKLKNGVIKHLFIRDFIYDNLVSNMEDLIDGQYYDLTFINLDIDLEILYKINSKKTSPLFILSFILGYLGVIVINNNFIIEETILDELKELGEIFGFIFQLNDDILDREVDSLEGKNLNIAIHLGHNKAIEEFNNKCLLFQTKMENLKLWNKNFKEIIDLLKNRIIINN